MAIERLGLVKTSLVDYPGRVAATLFTWGCNLRCPYCHNPECVLGSPPGDFLLLDEVRVFIQKRKSILGGVCITGGEPFLHTDLPDIIEMIRSFDLDVKIDTNGTFPRRLAGIDADFIDMDVKTSPAHYARLLGKDDEAGEEKGRATGELVKQSINLIKESGIPHRFRITAAPGIIDETDIESIAILIGPGETCMVSGFSPSITLDPTWQKVIPYPDSTLDTFASILKDRGLEVEVRYNHSG